MQYTRNYDFAAGTAIIADQIDTEFNDIAGVLNGNVNNDNLVDGAVTSSKIAIEANPQTRYTELDDDKIITGLALSPTSGWSNLEASITSGVAYISGVRVSSSGAGTRTYTASRDTYVDLDKQGAFTYTAVANGAGAPDLAANSSRIVKVVTNGSAITSYTDLRKWGDVGIIHPFGGTDAPNGYLMCDGTSYLRSSYPRLFAVIGSAFGSVDSTHFNVPDLRGNVPVGYKSTDTDFDSIGHTGGAKTVAIEHSHTFNVNTGGPDHSHGMYGGANMVAPSDHYHNVAGTTSGMSTATSPSVLQPYLALNFIIKI